MRWGDRTIREATLVLMQQIRNWRFAAKKPPLLGLAS